MNRHCSSLCEHRIGRAALDVFEQEPTANAELLGLDNVITTPHGRLHRGGSGRRAVDAARRVRMSSRAPAAAVNARPLSAEARAAVEPYLGLVSNLGVLVAGLAEGLPERVRWPDRGLAAHMSYLQATCWLGCSTASSRRSTS